MLGLYMAPATVQNMRACGIDTDELLEKLRQKHVVFVTYQEHHSNDISWALNTIARVERIPLMKDMSSLDFEALEQLLKKYQDLNCKIYVSCSAASNVTGLKTDLARVGQLVHKYRGLFFVDYAASGPYETINCLRDQIDAIFLAPHKNIGGPGSCGILVGQNRIYLTANNPSFAGGGTVTVVSPWNVSFTDSIEHREAAGTPPIKGFVLAALSFAVKDWIGLRNLSRLESLFTSELMSVFQRHPRLKVLGSQDPELRVPIFSFLVRHHDRFLHHNFVGALLNDLFGVQSRTGCSCAGPVGHLVLGMDFDYSNFNWDVTRTGFSAFRFDVKRPSL